MIQQIRILPDLHSAPENRKQTEKYKKSHCCVLQKQNSTYCSKMQHLYNYLHK